MSGRRRRRRMSDAFVRGSRRRHDRSDEPEQREEDPDDEHDPVTLPDRHDAEGDQQDDVQDSDAEPQHAGNLQLRVRADSTRLHLRTRFEHDGRPQTSSTRGELPGPASPMTDRAGSAYSFETTPVMTSPISDGLRAMWHPASSSASIFAAAVPLLAEMIAPALPSFLPRRAVS